jgi:hypothetical protein
VLDEINEKYKPGEAEFMIILDSLSSLPSTKELEDAKTGNDKADFTRSKEVRSIFRSITVKLSRHKIPMIITAHVYASIGCLTADNKVIARGLFGIPVKTNIDKVKIGSKVKTLFGWKAVSNAFNYDKKDKLLEIDIGGNIIKCTKNHKFMVKQDDKIVWKKAKHLKINDLVIRNSFKMETLSVRSVKTISSDAVYDIEVEDVGHYILDNGIVSHNSFFPSNSVAGGGGIKYASDYIFMITKAKHKDGEEVIGGVLTCKAIKNRDAKPETKIKMLLSFNKGLHPYYGLLDYAIKAGVIVEDGKKYVYNDEKYTEKEIYQNSKLIFTKETLEKMDEFIKLQSYLELMKMKS